MLTAFNEIDYYRQHFIDVDVWKTHVDEVYRRHFGTPGSIQAGLAGTYPTFIVGELHVVKFFGKLFDGALSFVVEKEANRIVAKAPGIPTAELVAQGELLPENPEWSWPYLIFEYLPGISFGETFHTVEPSSQIRMAREMGRIVRSLHGLPLKSSCIFKNSWDDFVDLLTHQIHTCSTRQSQWGSLPDHLLNQIDTYLLPVESLIDFACQPHLIHADITGDHLLGQAFHGRWASDGLIDWGDAMIGNILYELVALHLDLFRSNKNMLRAFLDSYNLPAFFQQDFTRKAMCMTLLHKFDVLTLWERFIEVETLEELASRIWDPQA